jgi:hypothetical protein
MACLFSFHFCELNYTLSILSSVWVFHDSIFAEASPEGQGLSPMLQTAKRPNCWRVSSAYNSAHINSCTCNVKRFRSAEFALRMGFFHIRGGMMRQLKHPKITLKPI